MRKPHLLVSLSIALVLIGLVVVGQAQGPTTNSDGRSAATGQTVTITDGLFSTLLDFGADAFPGDARYLEIQVRQSGEGSFTTLSPRQELTAVPYAMSAYRANGLAARASSNSALS